MIKAKKTAISKTLFSVIVALIPVLSPYASFMGGIYLEEFLLIIMTVIALIYRRKRIDERKLIPVYVLALEIICSVIMNILFNNGHTNDVLIRSIRMLFYIVCITFSSERLLVLERTMKAILFISLFSVFFVIVQTIVFKTSGVYIKGMGYFLPLAYRADFDYQYYMRIMFRPSSIFAEPAAMCEYLSVPISYILLNRQNQNNIRLYIAAFLSLGCLLTTSLWGIVIVVMLWGIWALKVADIKKSYFIVVIVIPIAIYYVVNSSFFSTALSRISLKSLDSIANSQSFSGRFLGYDSLEGLGFFEKMFGLGFGNLGVRSELGTGNAILYYLLGIGYIGTSIFIISCLFALKYIDTIWQKTIYIIMIIMSFGAGILNTCLIMYFYIVSAYTIQVRNNS